MAAAKNCRWINLGQVHISFIGTSFINLGKFNDKML